MAFGASTTTDEVLEGVDLTGRTALVTGSSGGIGKETARALAAHGAHVIMAARDVAKNAVAIGEIKAAHPQAKVEPATVDLASLASVRSFADAFVASHAELNLLIANAGVMGCPFAKTADGFEMQFGTNHLGHFVLVNRLAPTLVAGAPSRVVMVSSYAHQFGDTDLEDPNFERTEYDKFLSYGRSKTANIQFAVELDRRLRGRGVRAFALHPGAIATELARHTQADDMKAMRALAKARADRPTVTFKPVPAGAATSVYAAVSRDLDDQGGLYLEDCHVAEQYEEMHHDGVRKYALDGDHAARLWRLSETLVGETFPL
jgi:NAD(P)-dependent dehydrogenase (short-subunit alcohol dehydrogenase family)